MKLIIDIDEKDYANIKDCPTDYEYSVALMAIANGIPYKPKGEWIDINKQGKTGDGRTFTFPITTCSVCKKSTGELYNFCPNCGADMKGGAV